MGEFRSAVEKTAWKKVKDLSAFHWTDLTKRGIAKGTAQEFIRRWEKTGKIRLLRKDGHRKVYVNAAQDQGDDAKGDASAHSFEDRMWTLIRRKGAFTPSDLELTLRAAKLEATRQRVQTYCRTLCEAGYLRVCQTAIPGKRDAAYMLINDTGPEAPQSRRITVLSDPNTGAITPIGGAK